MRAITRYGFLILMFLIGAETAVADEKAFDANRIAQELLNDATEGARRDLLVTESAPHAAAVIQAMTKDLPKDQDEEYRRIPWIWRVAVEAGRENDDQVLQELLEQSLPAEDKPLEDWRAVVIGGGIVNGVSQAGEWPAARLASLIDDSKSESLKSRWQRTIELAAEMVDHEPTPMGTRYDALRILGAADWKTYEKLISKYLAADAHEELQMGAVSAAGDFEDDEAAITLIEHVSGLTEGNRSLAIDALLRGERHPTLLREALTKGRVKEEWLNDEQKKKLRELAKPK